MALMNAWRWVRYPRTALADYRRTAYARAPRELKGWKLWLYAIGALVAALAIWWPAQAVQMPVQQSPALERPSRPPHLLCAYRIPGRC